VKDAFCGLLGMVLSIRSLCEMAMLSVTADRDINDWTFAFQHAASTRLQKTSAYAGWRAYVYIWLLALFSGYAVVSSVLSPGVAIALFVPTMASFVLTHKVRISSLIDFVLSPMPFLFPGGDRKHSPFGLIVFPTSPRCIFLAQAAWHVSAASLCFLVPTYRQAMQTQFLTPLSDLASGAVNTDSMGWTILHTVLPISWFVSGILAVCVTLYLVFAHRAYMTGGDQAEDEDLQRSLREDADELNEWCAQAKMDATGSLLPATD
jgi:hypothetical protein